MIEVKNVSKRFGDHVVFENASFVFRPGVVYCLTGTNGCGKTVLLKMICGAYRPDEGEIILDRSQRFGVIIETPQFWPQMNGIETLRYLASFRHEIGAEEIEAWLRLMDLWKYRHRKVGKYSLGMRQRLAIAQALMEDPGIILMDEPTNALDDASVALFRELMSKEKEKGKTMILATHNIEDVKGIADVFVRVGSGKCVAL